jgi:uncharacterized protein (DUF1786 family)
MLVATVGLSGRTEYMMGRGRYCATIRNHNEDGTQSYVAHRYADTLREARERAEEFGAIVQRPGR